MQLDANNNEIDEISTDDESTDDDADSGYNAVGGFQSLSDLYSEMVRTNTPPVYQRTYMQPLSTIQLRLAGHMLYAWQSE